MDLQPNTSDRNRFTVVVAGDPIVDTYLFGTLMNKTPPRFLIRKTVKLPGGADNVFANLTSLVDSGICVTKVCPGHQKVRKYELVRLVDQTDKVILEVPSSDSADPTVYYSEADMDWLPALSTVGCEPRLGLVISDYNKGCVNRPLSTKSEIALLQRCPRFDFTLVDSRYGTYNRQLLNYSNGMKILHATGDELNRHLEHINDFKYVLLTDGPNSVVVLERTTYGRKVLATLPVPDTRVVDTSGAGDTFVASVAASLANSCNRAWTSEFIVESAKIAITHCQQVIQIMGASVALPQE